jgi:hypothetical protein
MEQRVTVRLTPGDAQVLDRLRGPVAPSTYLRTLLRRAAAEVEDADRDAALVSLSALAGHDQRIDNVRRKIETADRLDRLRLLAGD